MLADNAGNRYSGLLVSLTAEALVIRDNDDPRPGAYL